jgi:hypothetical protein
MMAAYAEARRYNHRRRTKASRALQQYGTDFIVFNEGRRKPRPVHHWVMFNPAIPYVRDELSQVENVDIRRRT